MAKRPWEDWLEGNVSEEELAEGAAAIEAAAERARQAVCRARKGISGGPRGRGECPEAP